MTDESIHISRFLREAVTEALIISGLEPSGPKLVYPLGGSGSSDGNDHGDFAVALVFFGFLFRLRLFFFLEGDGFASPLCL